MAMPKKKTYNPEVYRANRAHYRETRARYRETNRETLNEYQRLLTRCAQRNFIAAVGYKGGACEDCGSEDVERLNFFPPIRVALRTRDVRQALRAADASALVCWGCRKTRRVHT